MDNNDSIEKKIEKLQELIKIQGTDGNWNYDAYMFGMFTGMALSMSIFTDEDPNYKDAPKFFIEDVERFEKFNESGAVCEIKNAKEN